MPRNQALHDAIDAAGLTYGQAAERLDVNRNTVSAWVNGGQRPRTPELRDRAAALLKVDADLLWPPELVPELPPATSEVRGMWARRADVPAELWSRMLRDAEQVDYTAFAGAWVLDVAPAFLRQLAGIATIGRPVRVLLANPHSEAVKARADEEGLSEALPLRVREAVALFSDGLRNLDGAEVRLHDFPLYVSLFRAGRFMLVTTHLYALRGSEAPTMLLERHGSDGAWQTYAEHFERLWHDANPAD